MGLSLLLNVLNFYGILTNSKHESTVTDKVNDVTQGIAIVVSTGSLFVSPTNVPLKLLGSTLSLFFGVAAFETGLAALDQDQGAGGNPNVIRSDVITLFGDVILALSGAAGLEELVNPSKAVLALIDATKFFGDVATASGLYYQALSAAGQVTLSMNVNNAIPVVEKALLGVSAGLSASNSPLAAPWGQIQGPLINTLSAIQANDINSVLVSGISLNSSFISLYNNVVGNGSVSTLTSQQSTEVLTPYVSQLNAIGYYLVQPADTFAIVVSVLSDGGTIANFIDAATLQRIDAALGITSLTPGSLLSVPIGDKGAALSPVNSTSLFSDLPELPNVQDYVMDPSTAEVYTVGAPLGSVGGALIIDTQNAEGGYATFAAGTYSGVGLEADGNVDVGLIAGSGDPLGTLSFNPTSGAGSFTLPDGLSITTPPTQAAFVTDPSQTPEEVLLSYLSDLGDPISAATLDQDNFNFLNPNISLNILNSIATLSENNGTSAEVLYVLNSPGVIVNGQSKVDINTNGVMVLVPATNILEIEGSSADLSQDQVSDIQTLEVGLFCSVSMTSAQFNSFSDIQASADYFTITTSGTVKLESDDRLYGLAAADFGGTTLIGNDVGGQTLTASDLGDDTLVAGNGSGDTLVAGNGDDVLQGGNGGDTFDVGLGVDTVTGGSGANTFSIDGTLASGTTISGGGGADVLEGTGDITGATISGVQTLASSSISMTVSQLGGFSSIRGDFSISDTASNIEHGLATLAANAGYLDTVTATDMQITVTIAALTSPGYSSVLSKVVGGFDIADTAANIEDGLPNLSANNNCLEQVIATDTAVNFSVAALLADVSSGYLMTLNKIAGGFTVSDCASNIVNGLSELLSISDQISTEADTSASNGDLGGLAAIVSTGDPITVSVETALSYPSILDLVEGGYSISDNVANVAKNFDTLSVDAGDINSISFSDPGIPVLSLSQTQAANDTQLLADIVTPYDLDIVTDVTGQPYTSYQEEYNSDGVLVGIFYNFEATLGQPYSSYVYIYSPNNSYIGSQFFYTGIIGYPYNAFEYDYDGGGNVTRVDFTGVTGAAYSSYEYDFNGGVYAGAKFEFTTVPTGATYTSYETDYDAFDNFTGDKFFFTDITAQAYTSEEEDFNSVGALTRVLLSGVTGQSYSSLEEDYNAGTYAGYKAYYAITGQAYSGEEVDVSASNVLTKVVYTGLTGTPYSSVEEDFANGALQDTVYDFTNPTGQNFYAYQATDDANGNALQETVDNNDGSHTIVGFQANQTFTSIGNDTITGGGANETFVFNPAFGHDTVTDFGSYLSGAGHDTISLASSEFANFAAVLASAQNVNSNAVITAANGDSLTLANVTTSALAANSADFTFHA